MIDIFVEETNKDNLKVFFVQLGCIYDTTLDNLKTLCDNVVSLYIEYNKDINNKVPYYYLPVETYNELYKKESKVLYTGESIENINYVVKKVL